MKRELVLSVILLLIAVNAFPANFAPIPMKISAPERIRYDFDGKNLMIPVTVSGHSGTGVFCVFTKDKGASIGQVTNGFMGWHYVNKIDTSVYISTPLEINVGTNTVLWNGRDEAGALVPAGDYTYYLWGYDSRSQKTFVAHKVGTTMHNEGRQVIIQETGPDGKPLANPFMYFTQAGTSFKAKWIIGNDPADSSLIETCRFVPAPNTTISRSFIPVPDDFSKVFVSGGINVAVGRGVGVWKFKWVPNGTGELETTWGKEGWAFWDRKQYIQAGPLSDGINLYYANYQGTDTANAGSEFAIFDLSDGELLRIFDLSQWWSHPDEQASGGRLNAGPNGMTMRKGHVFLGSHMSCHVQMVNPQAETVDADFLSWMNQNGDLIMDHNFDPSVKLKWICNDSSTPPFTTDFEADSNLFMAGTLYGLGAVSFGLIAPDGTGIGYFSYAGDTD